MGYLSERLRAFGYAFKGIQTFFVDSQHARIHLFAVILVSALGFYLGIATLEWVAIFLCFALVLALEAINSAIEYTIDLISPEQHPLAKKAKDVAAGAVLICAIFTVLIALFIFVPKL